MSKQCLYLALALVILGLTVPTFAADLGKGNILFEWFDSTTGGNLDQLVDGRNLKYPDSPSSTAWRTSFEGPVNRSDNYATRVRGYLYPPVSGDYTFWIRSDDHSRLWLSTDEDPAKKVLLCEVTGSTTTTQWDKFPTQKSSPVALKAGKKYYIEALHRDGTGADNLAAAWGGPAVIGAGPVIIAGQYLSPWIRPVDLMAGSPSPADGELGVAFPLLTWSKGLTALWHDIYFGTDSNPPLWKRVPALQPTETQPYLGLVEPGVTYYWRVDEVEPDGTTHQGNLWSFTMTPLAAWAPMPPDGARGVLMDTLRWQAGKNAIEHRVFFSENQADVAAGADAASKGSTFEISLNLGVMKNDTTYYWRVDEIDVSSAIIQGDVWSFKTLPVLTITDPNLVGWWKLDDVTGIAVDYSGYGNHGEIRGGAKPVEGLAVGAIEFDGVNDYIFTGKTAADLGIAGRHAKTVTAWVYTRSYNNGGIFDVGARTAAQDFCLRTMTGVNQWRVQLWGTGNDYDFTRTSANTWVHFALVYDGAQIVLYANGTHVTTQARTLDTSPTNPFQIGAYGWQVNYFDGLIDDVRLYNKALTQEEVQTVLQRSEPTQAWGPSPATGILTDAVKAVPLTWEAGDGITQHDVYLTNDPNVIDVASVSDTTGAYRGRIDVSSYMPDPVLDWNDVYYWRVDEVAADGYIVKGRIWDFSTADWLIVDNFETYTNTSPDRIFQAWLDRYGYSADEFFPVAYPGNGTGAGVGHDIWSAESTYLNGNIAERGLRHGGAQSMPLYYDNTASPFYSETEKSWTSQQDWTVEGANALQIHVRGNPRKFVQTGPDSMTLSAAGADIWGTADQFRYAFKTLTGDGTIIACVTSNGFGTNAWAKGGVMIRQDNAPGAANAMATGTGGSGGGFSFQWRLSPSIAAASSNTPVPPVTIPTWVKLERVGNNISGYYSRDGGVTWVQQGTAQTVVMGDPVMIGVAVTSHAPNQLREFEFSDISTTGKVTGAWTVEDIGVVQPSNEDAMPLYVIVQDWNNRVSSPVVHPDANILLSEDWSAWRIPFTDFAPANLGAVRKIIIGVGSRTSPKTGGAGMIYIDNIGRTRPAQ